MNKVLDFTKAIKQVKRIKQLRDKYGDEKILVVKSCKIPAEASQEGFTHATDISLDFLLNESEFIPRYNAEHNSSYKQPIPYVLVKNKAQFFATKRLSGSGEIRLVDKIALGMGGHINNEDIFGSKGKNLFENAAYRELIEELNIPNATCRLSFLGFINDFSNSVGNEHLGLLYILDVVLDNPNEEITVKETDKLEGRLLSLTDIKGKYSKLEKWAQIVFDEVLRCWAIAA